jgi:hypothetical protein
LGCSTPKTPEALRDAASPEVVSSLREYREIYTTVEQQMRACYSTNHEFRAALYPDHDRGAIAVSNDGAYLILIEIFKSPEGYGSQVTIHSQDETLGDRVHAWLQGDTACGEQT